MSAVGRPFKPGQTGNPKGSSALAREMGDARKLNQVEATRLLNKFIHMPVEDLGAFVQDKTNPSIEVLIGSILLHAIKFGDHNRLSFLFDRLIGRVKEVHEFQSVNNFNALIVAKVQEISQANQMKEVSNAKEESSGQEVRKENEATEVVIDVSAR